MSSWRDKVTVSGEWEGQYYEHEYVVKFLEDVVRRMLSLIEEN
jgi:hypothetical protein